MTKEKAEALSKLYAAFAADVKEKEEELSEAHKRIIIGAAAAVIGLGALARASRRKKFVVTPARKRAMVANLAKARAAKMSRTRRGR